MILGRSFLTWNTPPPHLKLSRPTPTTSLGTLSSAQEAERARLAESLQFETLKILEWPSVCTQLSAFASTPMGHQAAQSARIPLGRSPCESRRLLDQTSAALTVFPPLDFTGIENITPIVDATISGEMLSIGEICLVSRTLRSSRLLMEQLKKISSESNLYERYSPLLEILQHCDYLMNLERKIEFCLDCNSSLVLDRASEELELIRSERKANMENLELMLKNISTQIFRSGGIDKPQVTRRRSRMCVAIKTAHKSLLPRGIILDSSSSGATYFMEPREAIDLNNLEVKLSNMQKIAEQAVLSMLSAEIAEFSGQIKYLLDRILEVDLAFARAGHARWMKGVCPNFSSESENCEHNSFSVNVKGMQHPLLLESSLKRTVISEEVAGALGFPVPVDFRIGNGVKVVVISGPNTGGKTASMKTLGLASIMSKAGMYLPAQLNPELPWFDLVLADIGDRQSLEQSLSTFSGHMSQICKILKVASERSLVLLDEIGSGTDPSEGAALSASILQYFKHRVRLAVVTTHYADLTLLKEKDPQFENAAMEFSMESLQPTYRILWGSTGESNALSIAKTLGFDGAVIERAKSWLKKLTLEKTLEFNGLLYRSLVEERNKLAAQAERATSLHSDVVKLYNEIREEADELDAREASLKAKETQQLQQQVKAAKAEIDTIVQEFEKQLENTSLNAYGVLLKKSESAIASVVKARRLSENLHGRRTTGCAHIPRIGDRVLVQGFGNKAATVVEAPSEDNMVLLRCGKIRMRVKVSRVNAVDDGNHVASLASRSKRRVLPPYNK